MDGKSPEDLPPYPLVYCTHHKPQPGYAVCEGVFKQGKPIAQFIPATNDNLGQILCATGAHNNVDDLHLVCATCARSRGWVQDVKTFSA
jgi:hypothetical protein